MMRRSFLKCAVSGAAGMAIRGPLLAEVPKALPATLVVRPDRLGPAIAADFTGLSYESAQLAHPEFFSIENTELVGFLRRLGAQGVLRIGGNTSEYAFWSPHPNPQAGAAVPASVGPDTGHKAPPATFTTPAAIRNLRAFLDATGWRAIYGLNLGKGTLQAAQEEAVFVADKLGEKLVALQFGNEVDLFNRNGLRPRDYGFDQFAAEWQRFYDAVHARVPGAAFAGPDTANSVEWVEKFAARFGNRVILLTNHYYAEGPPTNPAMTLERLLRPNPKLAADISKIQKVMKDSHLPFRLAEANSCYQGGKPGVSNTFGAALWAGDLMFQLAAAGFSGINFHGGGYGWYTPVAGTPKNGFIARPEFYGMLLFAQTGVGRLVEATLDAPGSVPLLTAYAVLSDSGAVKVAVFNKNTKQHFNLTIEPGQPAGEASLLRLIAPSVEDTTDVTLGAAPVGADGAWQAERTGRAVGGGGKIVCRIPAGSAALLSFQ
jgi:hypothetical protein